MEMGFPSSFRTCHLFDLICTIILPLWNLLHSFIKSLVLVPLLTRKVNVAFQVILGEFPTGRIEFYQIDLHTPGLLFEGAAGNMFAFFMWTVAVFSELYFGAAVWIMVIGLGVDSQQFLSLVVGINVLFSCQMLQVLLNVQHCFMRRANTCLNTHTKLPVNWKAGEDIFATESCRKIEVLLLLLKSIKSMLV